MLNTLLPSASAVAQVADLEKTISTLSTIAVTAGAAVLIFLVILSMRVIKKMPRTKPVLFTLIALTVLATTGIISGATVYLNLKSATGGPVHWHADIEFWACGNELELRDPTGALSNKIGTATLHEHNDKRIHLEGVPVTLPHDASVGKFMDVIGGGISTDSLVVPLNDQNYFANTHETQDGDGPGAPNPDTALPYVKASAKGKVASFVNGQTCGSTPAQVQLFAYRYDQDAKTYRQTKVADPANYEISHESQVPPGDCLIVEFAPAKDRTDKLCKQYGVRDADRCAEFGVEENARRKVCEIREVR